MVGITDVLSKMTLEYNIRAKKDSAVTSESLQNLEDNIVKNISSVKDEIINLNWRSLNSSKKIIKNYVTNVENWKTN